MFFLFFRETRKRRDYFHTAPNKRKRTELVEGSKTLINGVVFDGIFEYSHLSDSMRLKRGSLRIPNKKGMPFAGYFVEGTFQYVKEYGKLNASKESYLTYLRKGKIEFPNGDIWKGEISSFKWEERGKKALFNFKGDILSYGKWELNVNGEWLCLNTNMEFIILRKFNPFFASQKLNYVEAEKKEID